MNNTPTIGDLLVRPKAFGIFSHFGVLVGPNTVLQNTPDKGEHLATVREFAAGKPVTVLPTGINWSQVAVRVRRVLANPKAYNPFSRNCEHTATEVVRGSSTSPQLLLFAALAVVLLLIILPRR